MSPPVLGLSVAVLMVSLPGRDLEGDPGRLDAVMGEVVPIAAGSSFVDTARMLPVLAVRVVEKRGVIMPGAPGAPGTAGADPSDVAPCTFRQMLRNIATSGFQIADHSQPP